MGSQSLAAPSFKRNLVGLRNLGNTCFMNSMIQCLNSIEPLQTFFRDRFRDSDLNHGAELKGRLAKEFHSLSEDMQQGRSNSVLSPASLRALLVRYAPQFNGYNQQDSHECLRFFLDGLHEDLNRVRRKPKYVEMKDIKGERVSDASERWYQYSQNCGNSEIQDIFGGQLFSESHCGSCGHKSWTFDVFLDLSVEIPPGHRNVDISDCFRQFCTKENLSEDYRCESCKQRRKMTRRLSIFRPPQVLCVHLKRFTFSRYSREKLNTLVNFPVKDFDLGEFLEPEARELLGSSSGRCLYDLTRFF